jgi:hypothetical protein
MHFQITVAEGRSHKIDHAGSHRDSRNPCCAGVATTLHHDFFALAVDFGDV